MEINEGKKTAGDSLTIYVGDLSPKTLDSDLFRMFSNVGKVCGVKLIKRTEPLSSFAFVTFENEEDAARAIKEYNHSELHKRQIRLQSVVNKDEQPPATGNIFVKNLPEDFTSKDLDETFSMFGKIVSCKVATTAQGKSKGYGFVQFKKRKSAKMVIKNCAGGVMLNGRRIVVELYDPEMRKKSGGSGKTSAAFTNCFIKNFPCEVTEADLVRVLERYGKVTSLFFPTKEDGRPKGFAFANFSDHESALNAIRNLHGTFPFGRGGEESGGYKAVAEPLYIQRGQKKEERMEELRKMFEQLSMQGQNYKKNLYITNIPEGFGAEEVASIFKEFGSIVSISVNTDGVNSQKQYAYICYSTAEEASIAVERGNEIYLDGNKLQVSYFKNKVERMKEREFCDVAYKPIMPYVYGHGVSFSSGDVRRGAGVPAGSKSGYTRNDSERLHSAVLGAAGSFRSEWKKLGVCSETEFADKMTRILLGNPEEEIRSMIELDFILAQNIASAIEKSDKNKD